MKTYEVRWTIEGRLFIDAQDEDEAYEKFGDMDADDIIRASMGYVDDIRIESTEEQ